MSPETWKRAGDVFASCLELPAHEREALLASLGDSEPDTVAQVRDMLKAYEAEPGYLERSAVEQLTDPVVPEDDYGQSAGEISDSSNAGSWFRRQPAAFYAMQAINGVVLAYFAFFAFCMIRYGTQTVKTGWNAATQDSRWIITAVDPAGPANGKLMPGDQVLAINGDARIPGAGLPVALNLVRVGVPYSMRVARDGRTLDIRLEKRLVRPDTRFVSLLSNVTVTLAFFVTAVLLSFLKPGLRVAQRAWAAMLAQSVVVLRSTFYAIEDVLQGWSYAVVTIAGMADGLHFALAYHFYSGLYNHLSQSPRRRYTVILFYCWAAVLALIRLAVYGRHHWPVFANPRLLEWTDYGAAAFYVAVPVCIFIVIVRNLVLVGEPNERRSARWIAIGSVAAFLPYLVIRVILTLAEVMGNYNLHSNPQFLLAWRLAILATLFIPLTTAYVVLKYQMFDVHVVIRQGVQYLFAKGVLQAILAIPLVALTYSLVTNADRTVGDMIRNDSSIIVLLALLTLVLRYRVPLMQALDRRFFRENYREEQVLGSLIENVEKLHSLGEMAQTVISEVGKALHPECVDVLYRDVFSGTFENSWGQSPSPVRRFRLPVHSPLIAALRRSAEGGELVSVLRRALPGAEDVRRLQICGIDLVVPMHGRSGSILGLLLLGRKLSDQPYTPGDRKLLQILAAQMAIVCENIAMQRQLEQERKVANQMRMRFETGRIDAFRECPRCGRCFGPEVTSCETDGIEPVFTLAVRRTLRERYRLDRLLGRGGMGSVYEAFDIMLQRKVAVKIMLPDVIADSYALRRAYREARAAAGLNHPNIIAAYDFEVIEGEAAFLVMEYLPGQTMRERIMAGDIERPVAAEWLDQVLTGLEAAHAAGIVHRDLKPENILICSSPGSAPLLKILDFGLAAKLARPEESSTVNLTKPGVLIGSLQYMSPEQFNGRETDQRSDLFSAGVIAYELLMGVTPFNARTYHDKVLSMLERCPPDISPGSPELNAAIRKCLALNPADRFSSAAELRLTLIPLIANATRVQRA